MRAIPDIEDDERDPELDRRIQRLINGQFLEPAELAFNDQNDTRTVRGSKLEKDRLTAHGQAKIWIVLLFVAIICYTISAISDPDPNCDKMETCQCGANFTRFLGIYLIAIVCHTVFKIKFYCRAVTRDVRRRELKVVGR